MNVGMNINQRDIILVPFPFSDLSSNKKRPVIILSRNSFNSSNYDVICCAITSNPYSKGVIEIKKSDFDSGELIPKSFVKSTKLFTLDKKKIIKILARLNVEKSKEIVKDLNLKIEIDP